MSCAKKCDICGKYYDVAEINPYAHEPFGNDTSMVRIMKLRPKEDRDERTGGSHTIFHFDACDKCLDDLMDYILSKQGTGLMKEETYCD